MNQGMSGGNHPSKVVNDKTIETKKKVLAKIVQMGIGVDLLGAKLSLDGRKTGDLHLTRIGIVAVSNKAKRVVIIPWANIRGVEAHFSDLEQLLSMLETI